MKSSRHLTAAAACLLFMASIFALRPSAQSNPFLSSQPGYPDWSAFTGIKWENDRPVVEFDGRWYELVSIHGVLAEDILKTCREKGWDVRKRVSEDLVQILRLMGHSIEKTADLVLRDPDGKISSITAAPMSSENLRQLLRSLRGQRPMAVSIAQGSLSRAEVQQDVEAFRDSLEAQFAYLKANGVDYKRAVRSIVSKAEDSTTTTWLAAELQKVMARFIDGHAGVRGATAGFRPGFLPFLVVSAGDRLVAIRSDRGGLVDDQRPFVHSIDGLAIERWLETIEHWIAEGSPQYRRHHALRYLRFVQQFRVELGLETDQPLQVELTDRNDRLRVTITLDVAEEMPIYGTWPRWMEPQILAGNIGYLRIRRMDVSAVDLLREWMPRFRETDGLILDVRGNGGGLRTPILELAGYLLTEQDEPRIGNVAKYRLAEKFGPDHLSASRFVYRESSERLDERERRAIRLFHRSFKPQWSPPKDEFSEWHYLVLSKRAGDERYHYTKPVAILMDEICFSATDIFLSSFKGWPNVTLIGQPSGGGSARTQSFRLPKSGLEVRCASMASFQPDGRLYDTNGVEPDILVRRPPDYYVEGGRDVILERALEELRSSARAQSGGA